jgi:hypothetical protein
MSASVSPPQAIGITKTEQIGFLKVPSTGMMFGCLWGMGT